MIAATEFASGVLVHSLLIPAPLVPLFGLDPVLVLGIERLAPNRGDLGDPGSGGDRRADEDREQEEGHGKAR
jgi:hypothetical protein